MKTNTQTYNKALLFYPPVGLFQRGETRCQANIEESAAISLRACNDLGYIAAILKKNNIECIIQDYQGEHKNWQDFKNDLEIFSPDIIIMSITTATILKDLHAFKIAKKHNKNIRTIAQGAFFFSCELAHLKSSEFSEMDIAIYGEPENIIQEIIKVPSLGSGLKDILGIIYKEKDKFIRNAPAPFLNDLDKIPFPDRSEMNNSIYKRPDTGTPQATIVVSRGCPQQCTYCLTPIISGKQFRRRSIKNIIEEIKECTELHGISDFFFRADTFNMDKAWVMQLCEAITKTNLKINWVANSRVTPLDDEMLKAMKDSGCWLIALGIESGSQTTLNRIKKNIKLEQALKTINLIKKHKIQIYAFFIIGFYWETQDDIKKTIDFALKINCDFYEIHIATPYKGTALYNDMKEQQIIEESTQAGFDYFLTQKYTQGHLTNQQIQTFRKLALRKIYLRPSYVFKRLIKLRNPNEIAAYAKYGLMLLKNIFRKES